MSIIKQVDQLRRAVQQIENPARKGDVVALQVERTTHYQNPYRHETRTEYSLVRVASAARDGTVKSIIHYGVAQQVRLLPYKAKVMTIGGDNQAKARRLFDKMDEHQTWSSAEELKTAILAA